MMHRVRIASWTALVVGVGVGLALPSAPAPAGSLRFQDHEKERCLRCHEAPNFAERDSASGTVRDLYVDRVRYDFSAHAALSCRNCHQEITGYPHSFSGARAQVSCGSHCHAVDRRGRAYSHAKEMGDFAASVHGAGKATTDPDSPTCVTCHGDGNVHGIARTAHGITVPQKMALCAGCHDDRARMARNQVEPSAVASYRRSFHYKAIHFGVKGTAVCQDCHGVHRVLAKSDSASTITTAHLPQTCGQKGCHPGARMNFAMSGANHLALRAHREPILRFEETFFATLTAGTMAALVAGIALDVQRRLGWPAIVAALGRRAATVLSGLARLIACALVGTRRLLVD
jgi:hypothetical protein